MGNLTNKVGLSVKTYPALSDVAGLDYSAYRDVTQVESGGFASGWYRGGANADSKEPFYSSGVAGLFVYDRVGNIKYLFEGNAAALSDLSGTVYEFDYVVNPGDSDTEYTVHIVAYWSEARYFVCHVTYPDKAIGERFGWRGYYGVSANYGGECTTFPTDNLFVHRREDIPTFPGVALLVQPLVAGESPSLEGTSNYDNYVTGYLTTTGLTTVFTWGDATTDDYVQAMGNAPLTVSSDETMVINHSGVKHVDGADSFKGDYTAISKADYDSRNTVLPAGSSYTIDGSGLTNTGGANLYVLANGLRTGEKLVFIDGSDDSLIAGFSAEFLDATTFRFTHAVDGVTDVDVSGLVPAEIYLYVTQTDLIFHFKGATIYKMPLSDITATDFSLQLEVAPAAVIADVVWINMDKALVGDSTDMGVAPTLFNIDQSNIADHTNPTVKGGIHTKMTDMTHAPYTWNHMAEPLGYIKSRVTTNGVPSPNHRVVLFLQSGEYVDEVRTDQNGEYRFDGLLTSKKYMLVAQDSPEYGEAEYNAVAADFQSPTAYGAYDNAYPV